MLRALYTAASGMSAQQLNLDNIANNLANSSTAGFYSRRLQFSDLVYQNVIMPGAAATQQTTIAAGLQVGLGTMGAASEIMQTQGNFSSTGNPLDIAIQGLGFFQVTLPDGSIAYTRAGSFHLDSTGNIVTANGTPLQPSITVPANSTTVTIGSDGTISVTQAGQTAAQQVGSIQLAMFPNPGGLNSIGNNLYLATTASGDPIVGAPGSAEGMGTLQQGMFERGCGGGVCQHDRGAAFVRSEFTSCYISRSDVARSCQHRPVRRHSNAKWRPQIRRVGSNCNGHAVRRKPRGRVSKRHLESAHR
jgi:flagellar basal-body rod protein FlgG